MHGRLRRPRRTRMIEAVSRNQPQLGCWAVGCAALMLALGATSVTAPRPRLVWNASARAPIGLSAVGAVAAVARGDLAIARLPGLGRAPGRERVGPYGEN